MRRTRAGGDARLHDRWSIGVGGHLNPGDEDLDGGLRREWREELVADFVPEFRLVGLLNDDTTAVGQVHLGRVFVADAAGRPVAIRETDKLTGAFATPAEVAAVADDLETWSRLVFERLEARRRSASTIRRRRSLDEAPSHRPSRRSRPAGLLLACSGLARPVGRSAARRPATGAVVVLTDDRRRRPRHGRLPRRGHRPAPSATAPRPS